MDSGGVGVSRCAKWDDKRQRGQLLSGRYRPSLGDMGFEASMKTKPDRVVVHRIEMQQKEREIAEGLALSMMAKNWSAPLVGILGSPLALATIVGLWIAYLSKYLGDGWIAQHWDSTVAGRRIGRFDWWSSRWASRRTRWGGCRWGGRRRR